jgi:deleted-in-malignant-brain-tumors protein 1
VLNVTGIRLPGGSGTYEGRVEVNVNGVWGTICHNSFDMSDARVLCRMMGLSYVLILFNSIQ